MGSLIPDPRSRLIRAAAVLLGLFLTAAASPSAQFQMPDVREMAGIPRPVDDLANGVVTVRLVRGQLTNGIAGQAVELHGPDGTIWTAKSDEAGRAEFAGVPAGTLVHAIATVEGERLESQEFQVPSRGGIRLILVATPPGTPPGGAPSGPPVQPGTVALGGDSRIVIEIGEDGLRVFYLLEIINNGSTPVAPPTALVFDMPGEATGTTVLESTTVQANARGTRVAVNGPYRPGKSTLELAYGLPFAGSASTLTQKVPVPLGQLAVIAQKAGPGMKLVSPQLTAQREMEAQGRTYVLGTGPAIAAGDSFTLDISGLPHHSIVPRYTALGLALVVVAIGLWAAVSTGQENAAPRRKRLQARRELLFTHLVTLEKQRHAGTIDPVRYAARRRELMAQLERVYVELDEGLAA